MGHPCPPPLIGRLVVHDALRATWREVTVRADPACALCGSTPTVTELVDYDSFCGIASAPTGLAAGAAAEGTVADAVTARELSALLADRAAGVDDFVLVDVREPGEREIVSIPGAVAVSRAISTIWAKVCSYSPGVIRAITWNDGVRRMVLRLA